MTYRHVLRAMLGACAGVAVALTCFAKEGSAQTPSEVLAGQGVAERACVGCHAIDGVGGTIQGREVPTFRAIAGKGWSAERLQAFIATPHRPMPGIPLDASDIRNVAAYVLSLK